jgi:hypothetical protein
MTQLRPCRWILFGLLLSAQAWGDEPASLLFHAKKELKKEPSAIQTQAAVGPISQEKVSVPAPKKLASAGWMQKGNQCWQWGAKNGAVVDVSVNHMAWRRVDCPAGQASTNGP